MGDRAHAHGSNSCGRGSSSPTAAAHTTSRLDGARPAADADPEAPVPDPLVIAPSALTAVAGGDVAWVATYDAVVGRFAFHDDLSDLPAGSTGMASYLVAGWWSDPALDPLHDLTTLGAYSARAAALGWLAPEPAGLSESAKEREASGLRRKLLDLDSPSLLGSGHAATGEKGARVDLTMAPPSLIAETGEIRVGDVPAAPRQTLIHGLVLGVALDGSGPDQRPDCESLEVAVGPTGFGAVAALLADGTDEERDASERLLAAFAGGLLATIDAPSGLAIADEDRHSSGFVGISGGLREQPDRVAEGDPLVPPGTEADPAAAGESSPADAPPAGPRAALPLASERRSSEAAGARRPG